MAFDWNGLSQMVAEGAAGIGDQIKKSNEENAPPTEFESRWAQKAGGEALGLKDPSSTQEDHSPYIAKMLTGELSPRDAAIMARLKIAPDAPGTTWDQGGQAQGPSQNPAAYGQNMQQPAQVQAQQGSAPQQGMAPQQRPVVVAPAPNPSLGGGLGGQPAPQAQPQVQNFAGAGGTWAQQPQMRQEEAQFPQHIQQMAAQQADQAHQAKVAEYQKQMAAIAPKNHKEFQRMMEILNSPAARADSRSELEKTKEAFRQVREEEKMKAAAETLDKMEKGKNERAAQGEGGKNQRSDARIQERQAEAAMRDANAKAALAYKYKALDAHAATAAKAGASSRDVALLRTSADEVKMHFKRVNEIDKQLAGVPPDSDAYNQLLSQKHAIEDTAHVKQRALEAMSQEVQKRVLGGITPAEPQRPNESMADYRKRLLNK